MQSTKSFIQRNVTYCVIVPLFIGLHIGWFSFQQHYVPESERRYHPLVKLYKKFTSQ